MFWKLPPAVLAYAMVLLNVVVVLGGFLFEGRLKATAFQCIFLYASTVPAAHRGDFTPLLTVITTPFS